ncbi:39S ribosomal protein L17 [Tropilaelaps mercedesae]|uniref:Large ribosomal subunit protein bL17m n=1 Tax=Tropilaelaps mercedesae TaxID=418985 RepID=A0A1V9XKX4_9ACAR|nr:39S ribosomal protein L17 [Tropilaelaps mercedesae]
MAAPPLKLAHRILPKSNKLRNIREVPGRIEKLQKTIGALLKYERIELNAGRAGEARDHAERLIQDAIIYGPSHARTMEIVNFWVPEKQLVHKLFKVIAPRLQNEVSGFTNMWTLADPPKESYDQGGPPSVYYFFDWVALEIKGNPLPPIPRSAAVNKHLYLPNVLLSAAAAATKSQE